MDRFLRDGKRIDGVWNDLKKNANMDFRLFQQELDARWEELAGSLVARHTTYLNFWKNKLTIRLDSAPLKQEVNIRKNALMKRINEGLNSDLIKEIVIQ